MIINIEIKNVNSIKEAKVSFEKAKYKFADEYILNDKVANPIALYGRNGSGKSSLLLALSNVVEFLTADTDRFAPFIPNISTKMVDKISKAKICFNLESTDYTYEIATDFNGIVLEQLLIKDKVKLSRSDNSYEYDGKTYEIKKSLYPALREVANKINHNNRIYKAFSFLSNIAYIGGDRKYYNLKSFNHVPFKDVMVEKSSEIKKILRSYGSFPVYDIISKTEPTGEKEYFVQIENETETFELPYELASEGMKNQSFLLSALLSLPENSTMIVDELESALHPLSILNFIKVALSKNIQLIFSSHNTNILSKLRPDNIIFASWKNGESKYHRLSDIYPNIREVNNIEKMYLSSTFDEEIEK